MDYSRDAIIPEYITPIGRWAFGNTPLTLDSDSRLVVSIGDAGIARNQLMVIEHTTAMELSTIAYASGTPQSAEIEVLLNLSD